MKRIYRNLSSITGFPVRRNPNPYDGMQNSDGAMTLSALVRNAAAACGKIARDCLLLSSGPECGIGELRLGPGFPDPDALHVCKLVIQIAHQVGANDWAIGMAAQSGEPDIAPSGGIKLIALLESLELTRNAAPLLAEACVQRLEADEERCRRHAEESMSLATMASAVRGYADGARLVRTAWGAGLTCREAAVREGLFSPDAARELFDVRTLTDRPRMERLIRKYRKI